MTFETVDPGSDSAQEALARYFAELDARFDGGFDAGGEAADVSGFGLPGGAFVLVRVDGALAGCGGVQPIDATTAEIKRMWIDPEQRGLGLGRRLLAHLEGVARDHGCRRVILDTNGTLREAIAMYRGAGYTAIDRYNDNPYAQHWFAKDLEPA